MATRPSTSETRGRSLAPKPLSANDSGNGTSDDSPPELSPKDRPDCSAPNKEVHLPKDNASPEVVDDGQNDDVIKPRDFASDSEFWLHMTTTLDACFSSTNSSNDDEPDTAFNDLLADAPRVMQSFLSHGDACTKIEAEALDLVSNGSSSHEEDEPLKVYNLMLNDLEKLQEKATSLEMSISRLAGLVYESDRDEGEQDELAGSKLAAQSELRRVFAACLPVIRARKANLTMAQDLIDSAQENVSISLKMELLGID